MERKGNKSEKPISAMLFTKIPHIEVNKFSHTILIRVILKYLEVSINPFPFPPFPLNFGWK